MTRRGSNPNPRPGPRPLPPQPPPWPQDKNVPAGYATEAISTISGLYPPDSEYEDTAELGKKDMIEALAAEWRKLPVPVLEYMAKLQIARDYRSSRG